MTFTGTKIRQLSAAHPKPSINDNHGLEYIPTQTLLKAQPTKKQMYDVFSGSDIDDWASRVAYVVSHLREINARFAANPQAAIDPKQYGCIEYHLELICQLK